MDQNKYTVIVEWSEGDGLFLARALEFPSVIAHGKSGGEALNELTLALSESIKWMKEEGESLPVPLGEREYKGNISLRLPPETHRELALLAAKNNLSINQLITTVIEKNLYSSSIAAVVDELRRQVETLSGEVEALKTVSTAIPYNIYTKPLTVNESLFPYLMPPEPACRKEFAGSGSQKSTEIASA